MNIINSIVIKPIMLNKKKINKIDQYLVYYIIVSVSDGRFTEFTNDPEENVYKLPDNVSEKEGALVEPTAVAVQAIKEGEVLFGDTVAIFGSGPICLLTVIYAKAAGASNIFDFDLL